MRTLGFWAAAIAAAASVLAGGAASAEDAVNGSGPPPPDVARIALPTGRLALLAQGSDHHGLALSLDDIARSADGRTAEASVVEATPRPIGGSNFRVSRLKIDCVKHNREDGNSRLFDASGQPVGWLVPPSEGSSATTYGVYFNAQSIVCNGERPARVVNGFRDLLSLTRAGGFEAVDVHRPPPGPLSWPGEGPRTLVTDNIVRDGNIVEGSVLNVVPDDNAVAKGVVYAVFRVRFDCRARTVQVLAGVGYDLTDEFKIAYTLGELITVKRGNNYDGLIALACDGAAPAATVNGYREAIRRFAQHT